MGVLKEHTPQAGAAVTTPLREIQNELWQRTPGGARGRPNDGPRDERPQLDAETYRLLGRPAPATVFGEPAPKRRRHVHFADVASTRGAANSAASSAAAAAAGDASYGDAGNASYGERGYGGRSYGGRSYGERSHGGAATASAATATPVTASAATASAETAMAGTAMPASAAASALPELHFEHDDHNEPRPHLTENETEIARRLQILRRSVEALLTNVATYKSSQPSKDTRASGEDTPIYVLSKLIKLVNNKERRGRRQVLQLLYNAVQDLKDKRTLDAWIRKAKGARTHYNKLCEAKGKLSAAHRQLTALLRAFVITP